MPSTLQFATVLLRNYDMCFLSIVHDASAWTVTTSCTPDALTAVLQYKTGNGLCLSYPQHNHSLFDMDPHRKPYQFSSISPLKVPKFQRPPIPSSSTTVSDGQDTSMVLAAKTTASLLDLQGRNEAHLLSWVDDPTGPAHAPTWTSRCNCKSSFCIYFVSLCDVLHFAQYSQRRARQYGPRNSQV